MGTFTLGCRNACGTAAGNTENAETLSGLALASLDAGQ